jgi:DNA repair exonuclease SbcCD nuclease subunit
VNLYLSIGIISQGELSISLTKIGLITDIHAGYTRGNRINKQGVNVREADIYNAAAKGVENLIYARVDAVVDLGDMAHVPAPKKRAIKFLIELIKSAGVPWYSANGNHTLQRTSSDLHLYDILSEYAPNFRGFTKSEYNSDLRAMFIPYGTSDEIRRGLSRVPESASFIAGHWAANDVPFPGDHVRVDDLPEIPTFLGHYHTRKNPAGHPTYIGATERLAWGEANNPTGVAVWDTETKTLEFIDHDARQWVDIVVTPEDYLEDRHYEQVEDAIVRVTAQATAEEYLSLDLVSIKKKLAPAIEYQIRRHATKSEAVTAATTASLSLGAGWHEHIRQVKLPKGVQRKEVERIGIEALSNAGAL